MGVFKMQSLAYVADPEVTTMLSTGFATLKDNVVAAAGVGIVVGAILLALKKGWGVAKRFAS